MVNLTSTVNPNVGKNNINLDYVTDYQIIELSLSGYAGNSNLNLLPYLIEIDYFEDIFDNAVSAKVVLSDAIGIFRSTQLNGTEKVVLSFMSTTSTDRTPITQVLQVYSISNRHYDNSMNFENFTLNLCSTDLIAAEKYRVSKSYPNKTVSDIVTDVLTNFLKTDKKIDVEKTTGSYNFVLPNKKIYETINWLALYAQPSSNNIGADMLLYENWAGIHFRSLQSLYSQKPVWNYYYNPKNVDYGNETMDEDDHNILRLQVMNNFDTLNATSKGVLNNRILTIDPLLRKKDFKDFNYSKYVPQSKKLNDNDVTLGVNQSFSTYKDSRGMKLDDSPPGDLQSGALRLVVANSNQHNSQTVKNAPGSVQSDYFVEKTIPNRLAQLYLSQYNRIKIQVAGNSSLKVGDVINVNIFETTALQNSNKSKNEDIYLNGDYLITAIRHIINLTRYTTVLELSKESTSS